MSWKQSRIDRGLAHILYDGSGPALSCHAVSSLILMHTGTGVLHPLTRKLRVCLSPSDVQTEPPRAQRKGPHIRSGCIAEQVLKKILSVLGVGPCRYHDVMLRIIYSRAHEWPNRAERPALLVDINVSIARRSHTSTKASFLF